MFLRQIVKFSCGAFASRVLNPRLPILSKQDFVNYLSATNRKRLVGPVKSRRDATRISLKTIEWLIATAGKPIEGRRAPSADILTTELKTCHEISKNVGLYIGGSLARRFAQGKLDIAEAVKLYNTDITSSHNAIILLDRMLEIINER
jgi:hypothetical protein